MHNRLTLPRIFIPKYIWIGVGLGAVYWVLESLLHVFVFQEGRFLSQLLTLDPHEVWKRFMVVGLLTVFSLYVQRGINVRRRTEEALKASETKYRTLFQEALNPVFLLNEQGGFLECNQAAVDFFECSTTELMGREFQSFFSEGSFSTTGAEFPLTPCRGNMEVDYRVNGRIKTLVVNIVPVTVAGESLYYGIGQDITQRKQMEKNLALAHAELNQIFQTASVAMRVIDRDFNVLKTNETFVALSGVAVKDAVGKKCYEVFAGAMCHTAGCPLTRVLRGEVEIDYELYKKRRDGTIVPCLLAARPFVGTDGNMTGIVESFKDITELKRAQEEVRTERDKLRNILFQQMEGVGILQPDYTIVYQNATLSDQIGNCEGNKCFRSFRDRETPCEVCYMHEATATGKLARCEFDTSDGRSFEHTYTPFKETDGENRCVVLLRDITERKASRAAVIRSEQLAALGELAAGVAHEINNPINGIINYGQMLVSKDRNREMVQGIGKQIVKEGDRVAKIVENLLAFARRERQWRTYTPIGDILSDTLILTAAQMRKDAIRLDVKIPEDKLQVACNRQEIQQVFLNILSNARYALNDRYPNSHEDKRLKIEAEIFDEEKSPYVRVSFQDQGTGIPKDIVKKVMNPFFSTKPKGKGTGLGLSISHEIIKEHRGDLTIHSKEGVYTRVNIKLPRMTGSQELGTI